MKATQIEIKQNIQGTNNEGKETRTKINDLEQKEERNIQPEQSEEIRIQQSEESLRNLQDDFKRTNTKIIEVPGGEEKSKKLKTYLNK